MNVQIRFSGIFLLSRPDAVQPPNGSIAQILLPNTVGIDLPGNGGKRKAHVHHGFLVRHDGTDACKLPANPETLLDLYHADVVFRFDPSAPPGTPDPAGQMDFSRYTSQPLLQLGMLEPAVQLRSDLDPHDRSPDARLGARMTIGRGSFTTCPAGSRSVRFIMRGGFTPESPVVFPAQHLDCNILNVAALLIDYRYDASEEWQTKNLTVNDGGSIQLTVGFLCDDNPGEWEKRNHLKERHVPPEGAPDEDFRFLYRLLQPRTRAPWPPTGDFSIPVAIPEETAADSPKGPKGATTSTCFPGDCPGC